MCIVFVYTQLDIKTVIFETIQFSGSTISMLKAVIFQAIYSCSAHCKHDSDRNDNSCCCERNSIQKIGKWTKQAENLRKNQDHQDNNIVKMGMKTLLTLTGKLASSEIIVNYHLCFLYVIIILSCH